MAERLGLAGGNDLENAELGGIIDILFDFMPKLVPLFFEKDEEKKKQLAKAINEEHIPKYWAILEKWIQDNNSDGGWIYPTYADFSIYCTLDTVVKFEADLYPGVGKLKAAVEALPNIAKWIKERPQTEH